MLQRHRWTRDEWAMLDRDTFRHSELIDGEVVDMAPMGTRHGYLTDHISNRFSVWLNGRSFCVGSQTPVILDDHSEPEPDVWVARVPRRELRLGKPSADELALVVEVADTSARSDRRYKIPTYAGAGIPAVWIVDVTTEVIEVHSDPDPGARRYRSVVTLNRSGTVDAPWGGPIPVSALIV